MSDLGTKKLKLSRGRPSKNEVVVRQTLESWLELEEMVGKDVIQAYEVLRDTMLDPSASPTQKERSATKILELHAKFYKTRAKHIEGSGVEEEDEGQEAVVFQWKQA